MKVKKPSGKCWNRKLGLPGHLCVLQVLATLSDPAHDFPPCAGAGLLQARYLVCDPPAQDFEQASYDPHLSQLLWY